MKTNIDRIHRIIAESLAEKMIAKEKFETLELSEKIYAKLKAKGLVELALTTRINSIVVDLLKSEYNIDLE